MGVPVFFKWMCMRNPKILRDAVECNPDDLDSSNPYIDNFYVDMNGLIHPSCNPKEQNIKVPKNFEEQCQNLYDYVDKVMNIIRPRKLLYLAIDGVAPRAKLNQQRSRRFRAAMQGLQIQNKKDELFQEFKKKDINIAQIEDYVYKQSFDSNLITPGTTFLCSLGQALREYIKKRIESHRLWKNITVIFSDASCPGEGEHKIMEFIRQERASPGYDPNQTHCIYGADADLIMLGLATHEPRFFIIREVVVTANQKWCTSCGNKGHYFVDCTGNKAQSIDDQKNIQEKINADSINVQFQFLNLKLVRQFLHLNFMRANIPFGYDLERILDDFVFLCFFVGNDFLPHIPCLTIREGGIDILMKVYECCLSLMPDYLTNTGEVNFKSLKIFIGEMKYYERDIINEIIIKQSQAKQRDYTSKMIRGGDKNAADNTKKDGELYVDWSDPLNSFKQEVKRLTTVQTNLENYSVFNHDLYNYKEKYYRQKFKIQPCQFLQLKRNISVAYLQALSWICHYYYKGVASWSWFYPFHYSPFFSDLDVEQCPVFQLGEPFKPFQQLMAVLPPKTSHALPKFLRNLMQPSSPIADYFPSNFEIDLTGKKFAWLGQVLLPFIDDKRLLKAMGDYQQKLNAEEKVRNKLGKVSTYLGKYSTLGRKLSYHSNGNSQINVIYDEFKLEGALTFVNWLGDVSQWEFQQPAGRRHDVHLKEGIQFSALQELSDDFLRRLDRKSYGGQRFIRIIERSLGQRMNKLYYERTDQMKRNDSRDDKNLERSRSRDQYRGGHRDRDNEGKFDRRQSSNDDKSGRQNKNSNQGGRQYRERDHRDHRENRERRNHKQREN